MAQGNLSSCLEVTLEFEGGYVNHPKDPGGATNRGVTQVVYDQWRTIGLKPKQSVRLITKAEVEAIYKNRYWRLVRGDDLPKGVDLATFDFGVNSGVSRSSKYLQRIVGVASIDGVIGPRTLDYVAVNAPRTVIQKLCAKRLGFVQGLKIWSTFGKGWARRIAAVEATALSWVSNKDQLEKDAKQASDKSNAQTGGAVVTTGGGVAVDQVPDAAWLPWWAILGIVGVLAVLLFIRAAINGQRAAALTKAAKEA